MDFGFFPDARRARALDRRMHAELASSLDYLFQEIHSQQPDSATAEYCRRHAGALQDVLALLRSTQRVSPALFASYYHLTQAVLDGRDALQDPIACLIANAQARDRLTFREMSEDGMGDADQLSLYHACLDTDEHMSFAFLPPDSEQARRSRESVLRAQALIRRTAPELADEFDALVVEILLAAAARDPGAARFDGASSYMLWGALALSVDDDKSDLEMMETLAHECGHSLLFGLTVNEPLVRNPDEELHPSPLRPDPRPMDGIYHATFVSARMHYAMRAAHDSGLLDSAQRDACIRRLQANTRAFRDGYAVVCASGDLTDSGRHIMSAAANYMAQHGG